MQYTQRTNSGKIVSEILPYHYRFRNKTKTLYFGQKPAFIPRDKIATMKELRHQDYLDSYINPIIRAKEYERILLKDGLTRAELARKLGISRIRVTQLLNLLRLPQERQDYVLRHGKDEMLTEKKLRKAVSV